MASIETVKETIGEACNPYMVGTFEAVAQMNQRLDWAGIDDWKAGYSMDYAPLPEGAIRVGQVTVHHGDPAHPLWVKQIMPDGTRVVEEPAPPARLVSGYRLKYHYHNGHTAVVKVEAGSAQEAIDRVDPAYWDDPQMSGFKATQCTWMEE